MDKIVTAVLGAIFGFTLPYLASIWERVRRAQRMISALDHELSEAVADIEAKMAWVGRDVSNQPLIEVDQDRIVKRNGQLLYLGEREEFTVFREYWRERYTEIAEVIPEKDFSEFYGMHRLIDRFEQKYHDMKFTFETSLGRKDVMALACFDDLGKISEDLKSRLTSRSSRRS